MTAPTLQVEDLRTYFYTGAGVVRAVDGVSFSVGRGRVLGLFGESGSGKSVTGFSLIGLVDSPGRVVSGRVLFRGRDIAVLPEAELRQLRGNRIAMVFQDPMMTLNPVLRIGTQMIEAVRAHARVSRAEARVRARDALGSVGIAAAEERLDAYPHQFSGGQRQRIGIARALAVRPEVLVCDEAVAALDVSIQAQILNLSMDLREQLGLTYLFISHDLGVVEHLSDRVVIAFGVAPSLLARQRDHWLTADLWDDRQLAQDVPPSDGDRAHGVAPRVPGRCGRGWGDPLDAGSRQRGRGRVPASGGFAAA